MNSSPSVAIDSTFALAYYHLADAEGWREGILDTVSKTLALRAGALNRGLAPRESLLIAAVVAVAAAAANLRQQPQRAEAVSLPVRR